ncbi:sigma-70 family RNA polymerase sigma factor [Neorhodopirellula pilleata]|uniref:ECF RNA polymerase sigma factor SigH n=1 Tax=Neorhodopirellula pilleata TaxID=2714738 RepID=A0A5C5ZZC7_9BACT|nr:sigma-70 family RNA polymerase sigma factor [Neorhodopirellula pilleata]TWT92506.1 ECF RNA polymerase sigma factor SigH [Neorhodopirellula pilleata]
MQGKLVISSPSVSSDHDDQPEFEDAIERAQLPMFGYLVRLTGSVTDAQDLLQMTNVTAWTRKETFEPGSDLIAWMRTIAINHVRNESRRRARRSTVPLLDDELSQLAEARHAMRQRNAPQQSDLESRRLRIGQCLEKLTSAQRILIDQFYQQGLTLNQIAEANDTTINAIGQRLHRARSALVKCVRRSLAIDADPITFTPSLVDSNESA